MGSNPPWVMLTNMFLLSFEIKMEKTYLELLYSIELSGTYSQTRN